MWHFMIEVIKENTVYLKQFCIDVTAYLSFIVKMQIRTLFSRTDSRTKIKRSIEDTLVVDVLIINNIC